MGLGERHRQQLRRPSWSMLVWLASPTAFVGQGYIQPSSAEPCSPLADRTRYLSTIPRTAVVADGLACEQEHVHMNSLDLPRSWSRWAILACVFGLGIGKAVNAAPLRSSKVVQTTRTEDGREFVKLASGVEYLDLREGRGDIPQLGQPVLVHVKGYLNQKGDPVFIDTTKDDAPIYFSLGVRPDGIPEGLEEAISTMKAGGLRLVQVPAYLGYPEGIAQAQVKPPFQRTVPTKTLLRYEVDFLRCSKVEGLTGVQEACCAGPSYPCRLPSAENAAQSESKQTAQLSA